MKLRSKHKSSLKFSLALLHSSCCHQGGSHFWWSSDLFIIISVHKNSIPKKKDDVPLSKVFHPSNAAPFFLCFGLRTPESSGRVACFMTAVEFGQEEEDGAERQRVTTQTWGTWSMQRLKEPAGTR